jgi:PleD family two-component response regulator
MEIALKKKITKPPSPLFLALTMGLSALGRVSALLPRTSGSSALATRRASTRHARASASASSSALGPSDNASEFRVLAFEDSYDIKQMLQNENVRVGHFEQRWSSENAVEVLREFGRVDVLLLDFYLPPVTGLTVLQQVNEAVLSGSIDRPKHVLGMSSVSSCNEMLVAEGADDGFVKWDVGNWEGWAKEK